MWGAFLVDLPETLLLGFIAGITILLGLPLGRMQRPAPRLRAVLNAVAIGILLFLFWDVFAGAWEPIDAAVGEAREGRGLGTLLGYGALFTGGLAVGLLSLVYYDSWMGRQAPPEVAPRTFGPGAMAAGELPHRWQIGTWSQARRLALLIAVGIGLHNFAEGLAIGQSAARDEIALATLLVVGFALHNATEGLGIVAPLAAETTAEGAPARPGWGFLLSLGAIGGVPTFVGTAVGHSFTSDALSIAFLTLAAGSILYVVIQLLGVAAKTKRPDLLAYGLLIGLIAGFATDAVVTAAGV